MKLYEPTLALMTDARLLRAIEAQQEIQKRNPPTSAEWQQASEVLAPLFREMAQRHPTDTTPTQPSARVLNTLVHGPIRLEVRLEFGHVRHRAGYVKNHKVHELATTYVVGVTELTAAQTADLASWAPPAFHRALREFFRTGQPAAIASGLLCAHLDPDDAVPDATLTREHVTCAKCRKYPSAT